MASMTVLHNNSSTSGKHVLEASVFSQLKGRFVETHTIKAILTGFTFLKHDAKENVKSVETSQPFLSSSNQYNTTTSRYRNSAAVTALTKVHEQSSMSFTEEHAFDAIAKQAEVCLQHQRKQNREARQLRHKELFESNASDSFHYARHNFCVMFNENVPSDFQDDGDGSTSASHSSSTTMSSSRSRMMSVPNSSFMGSNNNSSLLQKFLNGDTDLRSILQRDLRCLLSELETKYKAAMIAKCFQFFSKQTITNIPAIFRL